MIYEHIINNRKFTFACQSWQTSRSWGHEVRLHLNGEEVSKARVRYYNRTWESYRYQSCMRCAVDRLIAKEKDLIISHWKWVNNKSRITKKQKEELFDNDSYLQDLQALYEKI